MADCYPIDKALLKYMLICSCIGTLSFLYVISNCTLIGGRLVDFNKGAVDNTVIVGSY